MRRRWNNIEGVEDLKRNVRIKGVKKEALYTTLGRNQRSTRFYRLFHSEIVDIEKNIRVILFSIHIDDVNPSRVNIKQLCGRDTRSQDGIRFQNKDLNISEFKIKSRLNTKISRLKSQDIKIKIKIQDHKHAKGTLKEFPRIQGSKIQDVIRSEAISAMTTI
ncbi:hypothetical protein Tco_0146520 [Tanacetum coccineum]